MLLPVFSLILALNSFVLAQDRPIHPSTHLVKTQFAIDPCHSLRNPFGEVTGGMPDILKAVKAATQESDQWNQKSELVNRIDDLSEQVSREFLAHPIGHDGKAGVIGIDSQDGLGARLLFNRKF